jgi:NADH-quinone oxidoreductase subunit J
MSILFYLSALISVLSTIMVITRVNVVHALLYFIVSLLSVAVIFYTLGAPMAAALEVIVYAGAIMVMFLFVMMMLNLGQATIDQERTWLSPNIWIGPSILAAILLVELLLGLLTTDATIAHTMVEAKEVGIALFGPYVLAVELASMLLLAGLVGAFHLARK